MIINQLIPIAVMFITFLMVGQVMSWKFPLNDVGKDRDLQVDGLRALLAFGVMTYHFFGIYHIVFIDGTFNLDWMHPLVKLLGTWTVPIFFSITSYLFTQKVCNQDTYAVDWYWNLLIGRVFRLFPVVIFICLIATIVFTITSEKSLLNSALKSMTFGFVDVTANNANSEQGLIFGPQWSLHSEWIYYLSLPLIGLLLDKRVKPIWLLFSLLSLVILSDGWFYFVHWNYGHPYMFWAFIPGIIIGHNQIKRFLSRYTDKTVIGILVVLLVVVSAYVDQLKVKIPVNTMFISVLLSRNALTKVLGCNVLRSLGETTYSIYLLHGVVQYIFIMWLFPPSSAQRLPQWVWWSIATIQVTITVVLSRLTYELVEKPGISLGKLLTSRLNSYVRLTFPPKPH